VFACMPQTWIIAVPHLVHQLPGNGFYVERVPSLYEFDGVMPCSAAVCGELHEARGAPAPPALLLSAPPTDL